MTTLEGKNTAGNMVSCVQAWQYVVGFGISNMAAVVRAQRFSNPMPSQIPIGSMILKRKTPLF